MEREKICAALLCNEICLQYHTAACQVVCNVGLFLVDLRWQALMNTKLHFEWQWFKGDIVRGTEILIIIVLLAGSVEIKTLQQRGKHDDRHVVR